MVGTFVDCCARELRNDIETNHEGTDRAETHPLMEALLQLPAALIRFRHRPRGVGEPN
jgi:hypothetical protein